MSSIKYADEMIRPINCIRVKKWKNYVDGLGFFGIKIYGEQKK